MPQISTIARTLSAEDREELHRRLADAGMPYRAISDWLRTRGYPFDNAVVSRYAIAMKLRVCRRQRVTHVDKLLSPEDREPYEALLADPRTTRDVAYGWLRERGYTFGKKAVATHRNRFGETLDSVRGSARLADAIIQIARENGTAAMSDGMLTRLEQVLLEQLVNAPLTERIEPKDLTELTKSVAGAVGSRETMEAIRREFNESKQRATAAGEEAARRGASGKDVVERVKEILGV